MNVLCNAKDLRSNSGLGSAPTHVSLLCLQVGLGCRSPGQSKRRDLGRYSNLGQVARLFEHRIPPSTFFFILSNLSTSNLASVSNSRNSVAPGSTSGLESSWNDENIPPGPGSTPTGRTSIIDHGFRTPATNFRHNPVMIWQVHSRYLTSGEFA
jgi:hypothetical protein